MAKQSLPSGARQVADQHPEVWKAFTALGKACAETGPLDARTRRLVKLALAVGSGSEGAVHSHVRRALAEGESPEALKQVAMLAIPTLGLPASAAALTWIEDFTEGD
ncbi:carboxymuconolactone decarboxylase family protein [Halomonas sp. M4R1S46]|uniref:carboxymuconolactone decarboxylase family protein n=1 Tax=Halomonas sp. M4R1S46 TaxID=2982692 RepID=UPI0021E509C0|nr:carboxymuconolactone decarboxylase family protein [Halomonas sp. M4R1S46]UYG07663.1 carboxymuconolactone decarboxylase family protein [Halomonas sp. M4R1S46]